MATFTLGKLIVCGGRQGGAAGFFLLVVSREHGNLFLLASLGFLVDSRERRKGNTNGSN